MSQKRNTTAWFLSLGFHGILAVVVLRAGFNIAFPEGSVEIVPFETHGNKDSQKSNTAAPKPAKANKTEAPRFTKAPEQNQLKALPQDKTEAAPEVEPEPAPIVAQEDKVEDQKENESQTPVATEPEIPQENGSAQDNGEAQDSDAKPEFGTPGTMLDVTRLSEKTGNRKPNYPWTARLRRQQGTTVLKGYLRKDGRLESVEVHESSGYPLLDQEALTAFANWKYQSGTEGWILKPFKFTLHESKGNAP